MKISTILSIIVAVLFLISAVIAGLFFFGGNIPGTQEPVFTSTLIMWGFILLGVAAVALGIFFIIGAVSDLKVLVNAGISIVFIGVLVLGAYLLASDTVLPAFAEKGFSATTYKLSGTALITTYFLLGISVVSIIGSEIYRLFK